MGTAPIDFDPTLKNLCAGDLDRPRRKAGPVSRTVTGGRPFFYAPTTRFVRDQGGFGPMDRHKAKSRTDAMAALRSDPMTEQDGRKRRVPDSHAGEQSDRK